MPGEPKDPKDEPSFDQLDELRNSVENAELSARERFQKTSHIALLLTYDLIDKLRYWEKETLELPDDQVAERLEHLTRSVEQLRVAYLTFSDVDL